MSKLLSFKDTGVICIPKDTVGVICILKDTGLSGLACICSLLSFVLFQLKKCMTTKVDPIFTYLRMLVLIFGRLCHLRSVTFPKSKFMCGLDILR